MCVTGGHGGWTAVERLVAGLKLFLCFSPFCHSSGSLGIGVGWGRRERGEWGEGGGALAQFGDNAWLLTGDILSVDSLWLQGALGLGKPLAHCFYLQSSTVSSPFLRSLSAEVLSELTTSSIKM